MIDEITVVGKLHHETVARGVVSNIRFDYFIDDFSSVDSKGLNYQEYCFTSTNRVPTSQVVCTSIRMSMTTVTGDQGMFEYASSETRTLRLSHDDNSWGRN